MSGDNDSFRDVHGGDGYHERWPEYCASQRYRDLVKEIGWDAKGINSLRIPALPF